jgi:hypothetical protein
MTETTDLTEETGTTEAMAMGAVGVPAVGGGALPN